MLRLLFERQRLGIKIVSSLPGSIGNQYIVYGQAHVVVFRVLQLQTSALSSTEKRLSAVEEQFSHNITEHNAQTAELGAKLVTLQARTPSHTFPNRCLCLL